RSVGRRHEDRLLSLSPADRGHHGRVHRRQQRHAVEHGYPTRRRSWSTGTTTGRRAGEVPAPGSSSHSDRSCPAHLTRLRGVVTMKMRIHHILRALPILASLTGPSATARDRDPLAPVFSMEAAPFEAFPPEIVAQENADEITALVNEARLFGV